MKKFEEFEYKHLDLKDLEERFTSLLEKFKSATSAKEQIDTLYKINNLNSEIETSFTLCSIRYSINVNDEYYSKENDHVDELGPQLGKFSDALNKELVNSKFKKELIEEFGEIIFTKAEVALKIYSDEIVPNLIEDNKLSSKYSKLIGSSMIEYNGETYPITKMGPFTTSKERKVRKEASLAISNWLYEHMVEFDNLYDQMIKNRNELAKKLGFNNYLEYGYLALGRTDYNPKDIEFYRDQIFKYVVPVTNEQFKKQANRLGIKDMQYYDYNLSFLSGNPKPVGNTNELVQKAQKMYHEMSKETDEFFSFMVNSNLLELEAKSGKEGGGYCTFIPDYKAPFIFSNFNGTSGDVDVLTHEAGHAFMAYSCKDAKLLECIWPTMEAAEIHSMSMEFFAYPWMKSFFLENTDKYLFDHMNGALCFLPYGVTVDEFQAWVYLNPNVTPKERREKWLEISHKYLPHLKYEDDPKMACGLRWFRQSHIFTSPLYYIDYTLAQVCAFQFFNLANENREDAWQRYVNLCKLGGSKSFLNLLSDKNVRLESPFKEGCLERTIKPIKAFLDNFDDTKM